MSKNFEEEYRQMIDSELPDLWGRIEAQLPKAAATEVLEGMEENGQIAFASETGGHKAAVAAGHRKRFHSRWMPMAIAGAAAVLCILASLPVLFLPRNSESKSQTDSAEQEDGYSGCAADMAADADNGLDPADVYPADEAMEEPDAASFDAGCQDGGASSIAPQEPSALEDDMQQNAGSAPESSVSQEVETESVMLEEDGFSQIEVQILDCLSKEDGEVFYEAAVLQNGGSDSQKGIRVYFRAARDGENQDGGADVSFLQGGKYVLSIYQSGETLEDYGIEAGKEELYGMEMYIVYEVISKYFQY